MARLTIQETTSLTPRQFITALTDFGPNRGSVWHNSQNGYLHVHEIGDMWADVTEGSDIFGGVWERLRYDWSDRSCVTLQTIDSNVWNNHSGWQYSFKTASDGQTTITYTITRFPLNFKAKLIMAFVGVAGIRLLRDDFRKSLRALESRTKSAE